MQVLLNFIKKQALEYEEGIRKTTDKMADQRNVKALFENFREELTGSEKIDLATVESYIPKMPSRKTNLSKMHIQQKLTHWTDFYAFMKDTFPEVKYINQVTVKQTMDYWEHIRLEGKFKKDIEFKSGKKTKKYESNIKELSPRTCNAYLGTLKSIFEFFIKLDRITKNPFDGINKLNLSTESREAFTNEELIKIQKKADSFIYPIFIIGLNTALREGDICTLRWGDIDLKRGTITRKTQKAGVEVVIPVMPPLMNFLTKQKQKTSGEEYVLPGHAEMYTKNQAGITWRFKNFLKDIGIKTTKNVAGRSRAVSIKDVHSLRHTFCYLAGLNNIPLVIVQSIVGHMTQEMTAHYQKHASLKDKQEQLKKMPAFLKETKLKLTSGKQEQALSVPCRKKLSKMAVTYPKEIVNELVKIGEQLKDELK